ncbi:MAG: hypothetical protein IJU56_07670 [Clostridia bacterium]|nr:hypothetical protein [Clostridia bacterium]
MKRKKLPQTPKNSVAAVTFYRKSRFESLQSGQVQFGYLAGVAISCISRVAPVVPAACGRYEIYHLK